MLCNRIEVEVQKGTPEQKGDWRPLLFVLTDGKPSDIQVYENIIPKVKNKNFASIIACAAGPKAKIEPLKKLTDQVFTLDTMDATSFKKFFVWVSDVIGVGGKSVGFFGIAGTTCGSEYSNIIVYEKITDIFSD